MAYFKRTYVEDVYGEIGRGTGRKTFSERHDDVTCDGCAKGGAVPFERHDDTDWQLSPWCWTPRYGEACCKCGTAA